MVEIESDLVSHSDDTETGVLKHFSTAYLSANLLFLKSTPNVMNIFSYYESFNIHPSHFAKLRATYILNYILNYTMLIY